MFERMAGTTTEEATQAYGIWIPLVCQECWILLGKSWKNVAFAEGCVWDSIPDDGYQCGKDGHGARRGLPNYDLLQFECWKLMSLCSSLHDNLCAHSTVTQCSPALVTGAPTHSRWLKLRHKTELHLSW